MSSYLYFPDIKSAAFRKIAALSEKGRVSQAALAVRADSMASDTSDGEAEEYFAMGDLCDDGLDWVWMEEDWN